MPPDLIAFRFATLCRLLVDLTGRASEFAKEVSGMGVGQIDNFPSSNFWVFLLVYGISNGFLVEHSTLFLVLPGLSWHAPPSNGFVFGRLLQHFCPSVLLLQLRTKKHLMRQFLDNQVLQDDLIYQSSRAVKELVR